MCGFVNPESENALLIYPFRVCQIKRLRGVGLREEFRKQPAKLFFVCVRTTRCTTKGWGCEKKKICRIKK